MAINFPTTLDTTTELPTESASTPLATNHVVAHTNLALAIIALETKLGVTSSAVTTTHTYKLSEILSSDVAVGKTATQILTNKTLGAGTVVTLGSDATGDIWYRHSDGTIKRLGVGSNADVLTLASGVPSWAAPAVTSNASATVKGIVEIATAAEITAGTATGGTGAILAISPDQLALSTPVFNGSGLTNLTGANMSDLNFYVGVGNATTAKTYWNFSIPYIISTDVPTANFWTIVNLDAPTGYGVSWAKPFPAGDATSSLITTNAIFAKFGSAVGGIQFDTTKNVIVEFMAELTAVGTEQHGFGLTESNAPFIDYDDASVDAACFTIDAAGALYGHTSAGAGGAAHTETLITGITLTDANTYRIEFDPGVNVKFYVNGVLKATNTTNLPSTAQFILFGCGAQGNSSSNGSYMITAPQFSIEK